MSDPQLVQIQKTSGLNLAVHPTLAPPDSFSTARDVDFYYEGAYQQRLGLQLANTWPLIAFAAVSGGASLFTGAPSTGTFGQAIRSLLPVDMKGKTPPSPLYDESSTLTAYSASLVSLLTGISSSAPWSATVDQAGQVYLTNGADAPQVWDGVSATTRNWGLPTPSGAPLAADSGSAGNPNGNYIYYFCWYNANTGVRGTISPASASVTVTAHSVSISGIPASAGDSQVTHWTLFRNTNGEANTYYRIADIAVGTTTYTDNSSDIVAGAAVVLFSFNPAVNWDQTLPDSRYPYALFHNGITILYGGREEKAGTVQISAGGVITGTGTEFKASHVGQKFLANGDTSQYMIATVVSAASATLTGGSYSGSTAAGRSYSIFPKDASKIAFSLPGNLEGFPLAKQLQIFPGDGDFPTGLFELHGTVYCAKRRHLYRYAYSVDPISDGNAFPVLRDRGLVNNRCACVVGNYAYILDSAGIYRFDGSEQIAPIDQAIRRALVASELASTSRIDWTQKEKFHAVWEPKRNAVWFFVAFGGQTECQTALVFEIDQQRWSIATFQAGISSSITFQDSSGRLRAWVADINGYVWALGIFSGLEGAPPESVATLRGNVSSATGTTITDSSAAFYTTGLGLQGCPVYLYQASTGTSQWAVVKSNTATQLTFASALSPAVDSTWSYRVGAIEMLLVTQQLSFGDPAAKKAGQRLTVFLLAESYHSYLGAKLYKDQSATPYYGWVSTPLADGIEIPITASSDGEIRAWLDDPANSNRVDFSLDEHYERWFQWGLRYNETGRVVLMFGMELQGQPVTRDRGWRTD